LRHFSVLQSAHQKIELLSLAGPYLIKEQQTDQTLTKECDLVELLIALQLVE
jgi:hypothetical protein